MNAYIIYKQILNKTGHVVRVDIVECDINETNAVKFAKLYNLQIPFDLRDVMSYGYIGAKVI